MKRFLTLAGIVILIIHFSFILIYCFPGQLVNRRLQAISGRYVFPVFNQNWQMFAPEPPLGTKRLYYRCRFDDSTMSAWIDPGKTHLLKLQSNRFWNYGKLFNIYESIQCGLKYTDTNVNYFMKQEQTDTAYHSSEYKKRMSETPYYLLAKKYFTDEARKLFKNKKIHTIEFMYVATTLPCIRNKGGVQTFETIIFPEISLENDRK